MSPRAAARPPDYLTVGEVATRMSVNKSRVYEWVRSGRLHHIRLPGQGHGPGPIRIPFDAYAAFAKTCDTSAA